MSTSQVIGQMTSLVCYVGDHTIQIHYLDNGNFTLHFAPDDISFTDLSQEEVKEKLKTLPYEEAEIDMVTRFLFSDRCLRV